MRNPKPEIPKIRNRFWHLHQSTAFLDVAGVLLSMAARASCALAYRDLCKAFRSGADHEGAYIIYTVLFQRCCSQKGFN